MAEKLFATSVSAGGRSDLANVNNIVEQMITEFGFSNLTSITSNMFATPFSQATEIAKNKVIDEGTKIIGAAAKEVEQILLANKRLLMSLVSLLKEQPVLFRRDIVALVNGEFSLKNDTEIAQKL